MLPFKGHDESAEGRFEGLRIFQLNNVGKYTFYKIKWREEIKYLNMSFGMNSAGVVVQNRKCIVNKNTLRHFVLYHKKKYYIYL